MSSSTKSTTLAILNANTCNIETTSLQSEVFNNRIIIECIIKHYVISSYADCHPYNRKIIVHSDNCLQLGFILFNYALVTTDEDHECFLSPADVISASRKFDWFFRMEFAELMMRVSKEALRWIMGNKDILTLRLSYGTVLHRHLTDARLVVLADYGIKPAIPTPEYSHCRRSPVETLSHIGFCGRTTFNNCFDIEVGTEYRPKFKYPNANGKYTKKHHKVDFSVCAEVACVKDTLRHTLSALTLHGATFFGDSAASTAALALELDVCVVRVIQNFIVRYHTLIDESREDHVNSQLNATFNSFFHHALPLIDTSTENYKPLMHMKKRHFGMFVDASMCWCIANERYDLLNTWTFVLEHILVEYLRVNCFKMISGVLMRTRARKSDKQVVQEATVATYACVINAIIRRCADRTVDVARMHLIIKNCVTIGLTPECILSVLATIVNEKRDVKSLYVVALIFVNDNIDTHPEALKSLYCEFAGTVARMIKDNFLSGAKNVAFPAAALIKPSIFAFLSVEEISRGFHVEPNSLSYDDVSGTAMSNTLTLCMYEERVDMMENILYKERIDRDAEPELSWLLITSGRRFFLHALHAVREYGFRSILEDGSDLNEEIVSTLFRGAVQALYRRCDPDEIINGREPDTYYFLSSSRKKQALRYMAASYAVGKLCTRRALANAIIDVIGPLFDEYSYHGMVLLPVTYRFNAKIPRYLYCLDSRVMKLTKYAPPMTVSEIKSVLKAWCAIYTDRQYSTEMYESKNDDLFLLVAQTLRILNRLLKIRGPPVKTQHLQMFQRISQFIFNNALVETLTETNVKTMIHAACWLREKPKTIEIKNFIEGTLESSNELKESARKILGMIERIHNGCVFVSWMDGFVGDDSSQDSDEAFIVDSDEDRRKPRHKKRKRNNADENAPARKRHKHLLVRYI